ncbi:hypothetical protein BW247_01110 [Acidihalobacter ferrooxydans]|uniref:HTH araC/xylS-type domain-containing protein n=2 Tax=Acidihalobacter ferrooxydans TaxID=1765967 RepID=A0A1P8UDG6_9GAMM|nr:hypothetical protein BW247_01110 [Acidihalobacter ferrooxydans]
MAQWEHLLERTFLPGRIRGDQHGRIERLFRLERLRVAEMSLAPQSIEHTAAHLQMCDHAARAGAIAHVILEGAGYIEQNGARLPFACGDLTFRSLATPSTVAFTAPTGIFSIQLAVGALTLAPTSGQGVAGAMPRVVAGTSVSATAALSVLRGLAQAAHGDVCAAQRLCALSAVPWLVAGAYYDGGVEADRAPANPARWQRLMSYIDRHLFEPDLLSPAACAASAGISVRYLHALFEQRGLRFTQWVRTRRLDAAHALLCDPARRTLSVASIAYQCGFASAAHFSRVFRQHFGMSPMRCRAASVSV